MKKFSVVFVGSVFHSFFFLIIIIIIWENDTQKKKVSEKLVPLYKYIASS